jgi:putative phosphoribosyl transferase
MLAQRVSAVVSGQESLVLALPRGGVPVAFEVARALRAELDVLLVRKLGVPGREELAVGAVASGGVRVLNHELIQHLHLSQSLIDRITAREQIILREREQLYRAGRPAACARGRTVIVVDDGLATGATMKAAVQALTVQAPQSIVVAVPVASSQACAELASEGAQVICLATPEPFIAVGVWYENFDQTTDEQVRFLLEESARQLRE